MKSALELRFHIIFFLMTIKSHVLNHYTQHSPLRDASKNRRYKKQCGEQRACQTWLLSDSMPPGSVLPHLPFARLFGGGPEVLVHAFFQLVSDRLVLALEPELETVELACAGALVDHA